MLRLFCALSIERNHDFTAKLDGPKRMQAPSSLFRILKRRTSHLDRLTELLDCQLLEGNVDRDQTVAVFEQSKLQPDSFLQFDDRRCRV